MKTFYKTENASEVVRKFKSQFPDRGTLRRETVTRLVLGFEDTGSVEDRKRVDVGIGKP
ncbi:MAG: hypothetical protein GY738_27555 [Pseudoalteromonas sp.]|nr:hypothetical protein [Pseudoalteromonas sp.]